MKTKILALLLILLPFSSLANTAIPAKSPTESLTEAVNSLLRIAGDNSLSSEEKKLQMTALVKKKIDLPVVSQRVASRAWKKATKADKKEFIGLFTRVIVNTYFSLLKSYTNEKIVYLKEEIKKKRFAKINTNIVLTNKKIPVNYKLIFRKGQWRIYDFSAEGISLISTYTSDYKATLKRGGLAKLNEILTAKLAKKGH